MSREWRVASGEWRGTARLATCHSPLATRHRRRGFTLIELMVVMVILSLLLTLAVPRYFASVERARETVLRQNLALVRTALDKFYGDTGRYPDSLEDLVRKRYLRALPEDPLTGSAATWLVVPPAGPEQGQVYDIHSGAPGADRYGAPYQAW